MPRRQAPAPQGIEDQVRAFEDESPPAPAPPANLGNFPDELDRPPQRVEAPEPIRDPEMPAAPVGTERPAAAPEEDDDGDDAGDQAAQPPARDQMAELETRLAEVEREREFLRLSLRNGGGQQQATPAQPQDPLAAIDALLGGFRITADDWNRMQADPAVAAEYLQNAIRAAIAAGSAHATQQLRGEFAQYVSSQQQSQNLRQMFYGKNPDLEPYAKLVMVEAQELRSEHPDIDAPTLVRETGTRVRARLKEWGVNPQAGAAPGAGNGAPAAGRVTRIRPARTDMGGGGGGGGRVALTPLEKQLREFEAAGVGR